MACWHLDSRLLASRTARDWTSVVLSYVCVCSVTPLCPNLCNPRDCSPPGSSVHRILQARILEWVAISFSRGSSRPGDWTGVSCASCIGRWILYHGAPWEDPIIPACIPRHQSWPTLCNTMDWNPQGSSVHGILQAKILKWVAISSSKGFSWPRDQTHISCVSCPGRWILYQWATWEAPSQVVCGNLSLQSRKLIQMPVFFHINYKLNSILIKILIKIWLGL